jgi:uncharacterized protein
MFMKKKLYRSHILSEIFPHMNRLLTLPFLLITLLVGTPAVSGDYQKGYTAYNSGDYATALREFKPLAEKGYSHAQFSLGQLYRRGLGVPQDYKTAVKWFDLAAKQGNVTALAALGFMYGQGEGVPRNDKLAVKLTRLAAEGGNGSAQTNLGLMYGQGKGVPKDYETAVKWYRLAAEQGNAYAQFNLGYLTAYGEGVPQDVVYAHMWGNIAVTNGNKKGAQLMDLVASQMTPSELEKAQDLARECVRKKYKGC